MENKLIKAGVLLFLLGLITGFGIPAMTTPRLGLSAHLEGVMNGMVLIITGLIWPRLQLSLGLQKLTMTLLLFGTYTNWLTVLLAGIWGAGAAMMPIAAGSATGSAIQEGLIKFGLVTLSIAMVVAFSIILWGLRCCKQLKQ